MSQNAPGAAALKAGERGVSSFSGCLLMASLGLFFRRDAQFRRIGPDFQAIFRIGRSIRTNDLAYDLDYRWFFGGCEPKAVKDLRP